MIESDMLEEKVSVEGSLPDQLLIKQRSSTHTSLYTEEEPLKAIRPKLRVKRTKRLAAIIKPKQPIRRRYFTVGVLVNEKDARALQNEPSSFQFYSDMEEFANRIFNRAWRHDERLRELKRKLVDRTGFKQRGTKDLLKRLYVNTKPMEGQTVFDIDKNYYQTVQSKRTIIQYRTKSIQHAFCFFR